MSDTQDGANSAPAGGETPSTAANEQTDSAAVTDERSGAQSHENANEPAEDTGAEPDGDSGEPKKPKSEFQKRIDRLTRQKGRAEREAARLAEENERLRADQTPRQTTTPSDAKPALKDYPDYDAYQEALTEWTVNKRLKAEQDSRTAADRQRRSSELESQRRDHFLESSDSAREKYDDFDEVVFSDENVMPKWGGGLIADTENPGEVAYFLAKNPKESKRIFSLHPTKAAIELGKLEVKLSTPPPKRATNAPPPVTAPSGGGRTAKTSGMSPDEIYAKFKG